MSFISGFSLTCEESCTGVCVGRGSGSCLILGFGGSFFVGGGAGRGFLLSLSIFKR